MNDRFLLIKQWGFGFWSDMEDVQSKLLLAEITNRIPVVFWGKDSNYSVGDNCNSFEQYFLPASDCQIGTIVNDSFSYYPPIWNFVNLFDTDDDRLNRQQRDIPGFINSKANVLVSDVHNFVHELIPWIKPKHPTFGLSEDEIHRYIINKYIKPQPDIEEEINDFYKANMIGEGPILAVHIRAGAKLAQNPHWFEINACYPYEIDNFLKNNHITKIFLFTDDEAVIEQYKSLYGNMIFYTNCARKTPIDPDLSLMVFSDMRCKGIDVIKDAYLSSKCDYFIGNKLSSASREIKRLKVWEEDKVKLI